MKRTLILLVALMAIGIVQARADGGCTDQSATMTKAAAKQWERVNSNYDELMPDPSGYMDLVKTCIGSIGNWTSTIGFKLPSIDNLLEMFCEEMRSQIKIPEYGFEVIEAFGDGTSTFYKVGHQEQAEAIFNEIWPQIWDE
jgi:hypothetical protein